MKTFYITWAYGALASPRPIPIYASEPRFALSRFKMFSNYEAKFWNGATITIWDNPPVMVAGR